MTRNEKLVGGLLVALFAAAIIGGAYVSTLNDDDNSSSARSSSVSSSSSVRKLSASTSMTSSSVRSTEHSSSVKRTKPLNYNKTIAPFDACLGLESYKGRPWFNEFYMRLEAMGAGSILEMCVSDELAIAIQQYDSGYSTVLQFDIAQQMMRQATLSSPLSFDTFGKREGYIIPLLKETCLMGTYDIIANTITSSGYSCDFSASSCTQPPTPLPIGRDDWPIAPEFAGLRFMGQLFTAASCGEARLQEIYGGLDAPYDLGASIYLNNKPSPELQAVLDALGFQVSMKSSMYNAQMNKAVRVRTMLRLMPFRNEMRTDDCVNCG